MNTVPLDGITLRQGAHNHRQDGVCLMEAVAWFAGEKHSDSPGCVCPVLERVILGPGAALMTLRDHPRFLFDELDGTLPTQIAAGQQTAVISRAPFLVPYYRTGTPSGVDEPMGTLPSLDKFGLAEPGEEPSVDDCYFRMLQPHEIQAGMAFPGGYEVLGTKRDQVKQLGNAVTPPVMRELIRRAIRSLEGEAA